MGKKALTAILVIAFFVSSTIATITYAQTGPTPSVPAVEWQKSYGQGEQVLKLVQTSDGGYAFEGSGWSYQLSSGPPQLFKLNSSGNLQWTKTIAGWGMIQTADGGYATIGGQNVTLYKYTSEGESQWNITFPEPNIVTRYGEGAFCLLQTPDNGFLIIVNSYVSLLGTLEYDIVATVIIRTDATGQILWKNTYRIPPDSNIFLSAILTEDQGFALSGYTHVLNNSAKEPCLMKISSNGTLQWYKPFQTLDFGEIKSLVQARDGGYFIASDSDPYSYPYDRGAKGVRLSKTNNLGDLVWNQTFPGLGYNLANDLIQTSDDGLAFVGETGGLMWLVKTDSFGNEQYNQTFSPQKINGANCLIEANDGSIVIAGSGNNAALWDGLYFVIKMVPSLPPPTPSPTPAPSLSPSLNLTPSLSPSSSTTQQPTTEPSQTPNNTQENFTSTAIIIGLVIAVIVIVGVLVYFKRVKK
jgi:hypothetical protein